MHALLVILAAAAEARLGAARLAQVARSNHQARDFLPKEYIDQPVAAAENTIPKSLRVAPKAVAPIDIAEFAVRVQAVELRTAPSVEVPDLGSSGVGVALGLVAPVDEDYGPYRLARHVETVDMPVKAAANPQVALPFAESVSGLALLKNIDDDEVGDTVDLPVEVQGSVQAADDGSVRPAKTKRKPMVAARHTHHVITAAQTPEGQAVEGVVAEFDTDFDDDEVGVTEPAADEVSDFDDDDDLPTVPQADAVDFSLAEPTTTADVKPGLLKPGCSTTDIMAFAVSVVESNRPVVLQTSKQSADQTILGLVRAAGLKADVNFDADYLICELKGLGSDVVKIERFVASLMTSEVVLWMEVEAGALVDDVALPLR